MQKTTRAMSGAVAAAALTVTGLAIGGPAAMASDGTSAAASSSYAAGLTSSDAATTSSPALIQGPLITGPLVDVGGILNFLQIGQFQ
ncbi:MULTISPECIES: hypothetical protein [unclassified Agrococcus]|uniref:hypothetical protein n=1 Tax=unclassified Agrococcus TaxID=2615065 RepID=UPI003607A5C1